MNAATTPAGHERACGAQTRPGPPCKNRAGYKTDHVGTGRCAFHGGATPTGRKHAQRIQASEAVVTYGLPREIDPHAALLEELHATAGHVAWLHQQIAALETAEDLYGPVGGGLHAEPSVQPHIWIRLYQDERRHFTDVAKTCIAVGIAERQVQIAEQQGQQIAHLLRAVLTDLGHALTDPGVQKIVRRHLTALPGGAGPPGA